jgi:hypothetical protein
MPSGDAAAAVQHGQARTRGDHHVTVVRDACAGGRTFSNPSPQPLSVGRERDHSLRGEQVNPVIVANDRRLNDIPLLLCQFEVHCSPSVGSKDPQKLAPVGFSCQVQVVGFVQRKVQRLERSNHHRSGPAVGPKHRQVVGHGRRDQLFLHRRNQIGIIEVQDLRTSQREDLFIDIHLQLGAEFQDIYLRFGRLSAFMRETGLFDPS